MDEVKRITRFPAGAVTAPPSKSVLHRAVICSALAGGEVIRGVSDDIDATSACVETLLTGGKSVVCDCGESGSTLRFLIPIALALGVPAAFVGRGRLLARPMEAFLDELRAHGAEITQTRGAITVSGRLRAEEYALPGGISSQYVTGLLLALPLLARESKIRLTSPLQSRAYVDITLDIMQKFGVRASETARGYEVPGLQRYLKHSLTPEGDYSQAAFFLVSGALGREVEVLGLDPSSKQGDRAVLDILRRAGITLETTARGGVIARSGKIRATDVDAADIPDLVPPLAAMLACADGTSRVYNAERLRLKESDRLEAVSAELSSLGADVFTHSGELEIRGKPRLRGGTADPRGDHRIAMMAAVAAIRCDAPVFVKNPECVRKSYPNFWRDFEVSEGERT
ncbi:MAG: 3-phosphoshikimate 1-carboxyvinyltransferase [Oscillospiraceae bacterium]|jgi:3-phosphoshikimate 1-carboxyvinyltransferase|nr:3-phosphoshikimate 1-carboxyvinyltransferase [Oscillospiraceae bacterium]